MAESIWVWEDDLKRYRDTKTGRFIGIQQMNNMREDFFFSQKKLCATLANDYNEGRISFRDFNTQIKQVIKDTYIDMYAMGAGGRNSMSQRDWGRIGAMLKEQYGANSYLEGFMRQIDAGQLSEAQIASRLNMYINSANEAMWKGYTSDMPPLPAYPGDGSTVCLTNCQCTWDIQPVEGGFNCYWTLGPAEHCPDCLERASRWNPLFIPYGIGG